jgi:hypothetical protein
MPPQRYVILEHAHHGVHYDLMLEVAGVLWTWRLAEPPRAGVRQPAERSFDHRLLYLDYEGPVSGDRGHVTRWDAGTWTGDANAGPLCVRIEGRRLRGRLELHPVAGAEWELRYEAD